MGLSWSTEEAGNRCLTPCPIAANCHRPQPHRHSTVGQGGMRMTCRQGGQSQVSDAAERQRHPAITAQRPTPNADAATHLADAQRGGGRHPGVDGQQVVDSQRVVEGDVVQALARLWEAK